MFKQRKWENCFDRLHVLQSFARNWNEPVYFFFLLFLQFEKLWKKQNVELSLKGICNYVEITGRRHKRCQDNRVILH